MIKTNPNIDYGKSFQTLKNDIMKVTVTRILQPGETPCFEVRKDGTLIRVFQYHPNRLADDPYNEERNMEAAKELAKQLENGFERTEEIIYQSPDDKDDLGELFTHQK